MKVRWSSITSLSLRQGLLVVGALALAWLIFFFVRKFFANKKRRRSDQRKFSADERKILTSAKKLMREQKVVAAAQLLQSIHLTREAISTLESHGFFAEAANILLKMQLPERAAALYFRNQQFPEAMRFYRQANLPLEVARCEKALGQWQAAAESFLIAEVYSEAAECFAQAQDFRNAAKYYAKVNNKTRAVEFYFRLQETAKDLARIGLENFEIELLLDVVGQGMDLPLADFLVYNGKLPDAILTLAGKGQIADACKVYQRARTDIAEQLVKRVEGDQKLQELLVDVFVNLGNHMFAGLVSESLEQWAKAEEFYIKANFTEGVERCQRMQGKPVASETAPPPTNMPPPPTVAKISPTAIEMARVFIDAKFLADLDLEEKQNLWDAGMLDEYADEEKIVEKDKLPEGLYFVISGLVELMFYTPDTSEYHSCKPGETFAANFALVGESVDFEATAKGETTVLVVPQKELEKLFDSRGAIARKIYRAFLRHGSQLDVTYHNHRKISQAS